MRRLIVQELITVDGYVAGPQGELDFFDSVSDYSHVDQDNLQILEDVDTVLLGADTYRMFVQYWPTADETVATMVNTMPKLVFSSTLDEAPWGTWRPAQVVKGDAAAKVADLKRQPGKDIMVWGSLTLARALTGAGLLDELQLRVVPVAIGDGLRLFPQNLGRLDLELIEAKPYPSGIISTRYRPSPA
ncbi:reductase [Actinomadura sp. KC216]|uniref:dihydrofolate reductase family protein n=1 Tax=Actinomadura sp. KC216 TaxID=2530370 RepID=UPI0010522CD1|nr:dihydrofolate reductase family protein [Actinomadura sp. KC216]TDB87082.1 reductase [Actinomadura sp. KC216]